MLSVFITPWMKPTFIHCAISAAWRSATARSSAEVALGRAGQRRVVARDACSRPARAACRARRARRRYWKVPTRRWLAATRVSTAPGSGVSRCTGSPVAATASARVVGMPSACIASPISTSRSIGPTAALPSPPRENGVRPEPLKAMSRRRPCAVDHLAEQQRAAVAELRREAAELVAGIGLRERRRRPRAARCRRTAPRRRRRRSAAASRPSSAASAWFRNSSRGAGTVAGCQGRYRPGRSRA